MRFVKTLSIRRFMKTRREVIGREGGHRTALYVICSHVHNGVSCQLERYSESVGGFVRELQCIQLLGNLWSAAVLKLPLTPGLLCLTPLTTVWTAGAAWYHPRSTLQWCAISLFLKNISITNSMDRVLPGKPKGLQLFKKFLTFDGSWRFITVSTTARHRSLFWARSIRSMTRISLLEDPF